MTELNDSIKLKGSVRAQLFSEDGTCIYDHTDHNLVVTVGLAYLATWLAASPQSGTFMSYMGLGTGTATPALGDTGLQTPLPTYVQGVLSSPSSAVWQNVTTFAAGINTNSAITEAGLFSTGGPGTMFAHKVFAPINKGSGNALVVTWSVTFN
jgi:hypothetical protein